MILIYSENEKERSEDLVATWYVGKSELRSYDD